MFLNYILIIINSIYVNKNKKNQGDWGHFGNATAKQPKVDLLIDLKNAVESKEMYLNKIQYVRVSDFKNELKLES